MANSTPTVFARPLAGVGALVTGGSRGIGRAITTRLAADGAAVVFTYSTQAQAAEELVAEVTAAGGWARSLQLDLREHTRFDDVFTTAEQAFGEAGARGLGVVVANAGVAAHAPIDEVDGHEWDRVMDINAKGTFLTVQHAADHMLDGGRIVTISTIGTAWPSPGEAVYAASKAAVEQISRVASRELGRRGITVNTICPGPTDTDLLRAGASPDALDGAAAMTALGRIGQPGDIADLVAILAHPDTRWLTGQVIRADGGLT